MTACWLLPLVLASGVAETDYYAGIAAYRAGDLPAAQARFERVVAVLPPRSEFHLNSLYNLGRIAGRSDRPCEALRWLDRFLDGAAGAEFVTAVRLDKARKHRLDADRGCVPSPTDAPASWSASVALGEAAVLTDAVHRGAIEVEATLGRSLGAARLEAAVAVGVEPPAPVLVRPGVTWSFGSWRARGTAQILVRPLVGFGALVGAARAVPLGAWTLEPGVDGGAWPADGVYTLGFRVGIRRGW